MQIKIYIINMYSLNNYKNFVLKPHKPKIINISDFMYLIKEPNKYNDKKHMNELYSLINCGIFLDNNINLLKNYNFNNKIYERNLISITETLLLRSMNIYKPSKKFNYKVSLAHAIRAYDMIYAIQIRTILNPLINVQIQQDIDNLIFNSVANIHEQLLQVDYIIESKK